METQHSRSLRSHFSDFRFRCIESNRWFQSRLGLLEAYSLMPFSLRIKNFGTQKGYGVIANEYIPVDALILVYGGERIDLDEAVRRDAIYEAQDSGCYIYTCTGKHTFWYNHAHIHSRLITFTSFYYLLFLISHLLVWTQRRHAVKTV